ncbi:phenylalanine--tRNA ligase subunit beta [Clostridium luticellarii]|uniref:Phenylalanine--tRNA ligase beta subunit n=1 Tax=Clostridium luticellarii TaxID=1691940 RepID=A0A2T0BQV3_9CLOT|nr:phenylalanine--tRNA ligase subunit beta [Clostridium luticellarii]MCI1946299.1 phenylalanine--tRNA ligase subunit beta [Clostridium luticellarii]MCI1969508.1 phenylalanine--tRNA ligase subunit beta [Clostridium luticellarii]MCI1996685.1 phenylalanine--tRNA ligase subunit beta [Clostridium luticellarii]MCI2041212.1 phenylalanine--tRNA ligase subunit beta [Clostridium luticellarii]PRR86261.1 Phenylalanine--tRNA ligase beta subunit [Clostridium luticellarii]
MKVPVNWLKDYVKVDITGKELGDKLTLSGSKVEEVITTGDEIQNVVTGKIMKIEEHPHADKLVICQVNIGKDELLQIITAATNMKENDVVPVALHDSIIHGGVKIKKGKLRGIMSNGMFCSEEELGIAGDKPVHGLMILPPNTPIGKDIKEVLNMTSSILDFEITSNRPDCLSIIGMARETAATLNENYNMPELNYVPSSHKNIKDDLQVEVKDDLCRRYIARGIENVKIEPSPGWMQERLLDAGVRPINNLVDITNFVMLEMGQPMHAYDTRYIQSNSIIIERAEKGEEFVTLDDEKRSLDENVLTIRDGKRAVGIAGIMGGLNSEIREDTSSVVFESANFNGTNIRISSQSLGLRTEASARFEKDLDPNLAETAMNRACYLVEKLKAGKVMQGTIDIYREKVEPASLKVNYNWINKFLGTKISADEMAGCLNRLELNTEIQGETLKVEIPTFRRRDIKIKEDIAEEVARIYGYGNIPSAIIKSVSTRGGKSPKQKLDDEVLRALTSSGLNQSISYSFISRKVFDKILLPEDSVLRNAVAVKNPLGEDYSIMRTTTIPSMMESLSRNYSRKNQVVRLFEIGKVYIPNKDADKLPDEKNTVTIGIYGGVDYFNLKGVVENILEVLGIEKFSFERESSNPTFHPGKTAALYIKKNQVGVLGEIHPGVLDNYGIGEKCCVAELNLDVLYRYSNRNKKYRPLPKFPSVVRDLAILVDEDILTRELEDVIKKQGGNMVESVKIFDVYRGKQVAEGKKSIAYSISYRLENRTLTDEEVNKVHDRILGALEHKFRAQLR